MAEFDSCYVFMPQRQRGGVSKRRKLDSSSRYPVNPAARLLNGYEASESQNKRLETSERLWKGHATALNALLSDTALSTAASIAAFIDEKSRYKAKDLVPAGILVTRSGTGVPSALLRSAIERTQSVLKTLDVEIIASQHPTVKSIVRLINEKALGYADNHGDGLSVETHSNSRGLNYDLYTLHQCVLRHQIKHVMVLVQDVESMDPKTIGDLVELIHAWQNRIPFFLFIGVQTSLNLFESKLSERTMQALDGRSFEIEDVKFEGLFRMFCDPDSMETSSVSGTESPSSRPRLWIGPNLARRMAARHNENVLPASSFIKIVKAIFMSHFFANAFSVALDEDWSATHMTIQHAYAIRCLPSFQSYCQARIEDGAHAEVKKLLVDDDYLRQIFVRNLTLCSESLRSAHTFVDLIYRLSTELLDKAPSYVELYAAGMSGQLASSHFALNVSSLLLRAPLNTAEMVVDELAMISKLQARVIPLKRELQALRRTHAESNNFNPRSSHNLTHQSVRTTIVASKVGLSQQAANLTKEEKAYTAILDKIHAAFVAYLEQEVQDPLTAFPVEALMYDLPIPIRTTAGPSIRQSLERGLHQCHHYLGREHCNHNGPDACANEPSTLSLYKLSLECGDTINVADLWTAFLSATSTNENDETSIEDQSALASFETGLAELKYLGIIKANRKRPECLTKTTFKGL